MTLSSVLSVLSFADLGLGNGLMTAIARASAQGGRDAVRRLISSAVAVLSLVTAILGIALCVAIVYLPFDRWLGATAIETHEVRTILLVFTLGILATGIPNLAVRVQAGLQSGYIGSLWMAVGTVATLATTLLAAQAGLSFVSIVSLSVAMPFIAATANYYWYFSWRAPNLKPALAFARRSDSRILFRTSFLFLILQICAALTFTTDNFLIAAAFGVEAIPPYAVPARLFSCINFAVALVVQPLWPAYADAAARNDVSWVRQAFKRSLLFSLAFSILAASGIYVFRDPIFNVWTGSALAVDERILAALAVWAVIESISTAIAMLFNGLHIVRFQVAISIILTVASFPVRWFFLQNFGIWALPVATSLVCTITALIPCLIILPRVLNARRPSRSP